MVPRRLLLVVFLILLLVVNIQSISSGKKPNEIDSKISQIFDSGEEKVKVIIKLKDVIKHKTGPLGILTEETPISRKEAIEKTGIENKVKHRFSSFNGFSAELTESEIKKLEESGYVEHISYDYPVSILLQDSVPLINATTTWNLQSNGLNLTGQGQTVCVIDTGVNYTHSDLGGCTTQQFLDGECTKIIGGHDFCADDTSCSTEDTDPIDVHGHGTHVTGIVAANGSIKGVAPDANIVSIKVFNSTGSGSFSDIAAGIEWCSDNSTVFNITVISMSLGGGSSSEYCDDDYTSTKSAIDAAVAKNISVTVATGNSGSTTQISSPACIQNSTRIGSTTKEDAISSFSNRWALDMLFAPGSNINSTLIGGLYGLKSGTSMATPHAAGAIAILRQYIDSINTTKTPKEIESILNSTGTLIDDTGGSGQFISKINVYDALLDLIEISPTLVSPGNNSFVNQNQTFICNATSTTQLSNSTFYIWNSTQSLINTSTQNTTGTANSTEFSFNFTTEDTYKWNCLFHNSQTNNLASENFTITYDITNPLISFSSPTQSNNSNVSQGSIFANTTIVETNFANITFILFNSTTQVNQTIYSTEIFEINWTGLSDEIYTYNATVFDLAGNSNSTETRTITLDTTPPNIQFVSPTDTNNSFLSQNYIETNITFTDDRLDTAIIYLYNSTGLVQSNSSTTSPFFWNVTGLLDDVYYLNATANDTVGNINQTETRTITLDIVKPSLNITSPTNNSWLNGERFNVTITDTNDEGSCNYSRNSGITNTTMNTTNNITFSYVNETAFGSSDQDQVYNVTFYCQDLAGNLNASELIFFNVDLTEPNVTSISPENSHEVTGTTTFEFVFNVTDNLNVTLCNLIIDDATDQTNETTFNQSINHTFSKSVSPGSYNWKIECKDDALNTGNSTYRSLTVNSPPSSGSSGGSGGGGGGGGSAGVSTKTETNQETDTSDQQSSRGGSIETITKEVIVYVPTLNNQKLEDIIKRVLDRDLTPQEKKRLIDMSSVLADDLGITRKAFAKDNETKIETKFKYNGNFSIDTVLFYDKIPKSFASNASDIEVIAPNATVEIVEEDPEFLFAYNKLDPGQELEVNYIIKEQLYNTTEELDSLLEGFSVEVFGESLQQEQSSQSGFVPLTAILVVIICVVMFFIWKKPLLRRK